MSLSIPTVCSYMLASSAELLRAQELCGFLKEMDREENERLAKEGERLTQELLDLESEYSWSNIATEAVADGVKTGTTILAVLTVGIYAIDSRGDSAKLRWGLTLGGLFGGFTGCVISVCRVAGSCNMYRDKKFSIETALVLTDAHELRLKEKIRVIGVRLQSLHEENEKRQLPIASDWFNQKLDAIKARRATQTVAVVHIRA